MKRALLLTAAALGAIASLPAQAATVFVGSWQVDEGPTWSSSPPNGPLAYTAQEAAALLFGGSPTDYAISTIDNLVENINHLGWYSVLGSAGGVERAEDYSRKYLGQFYGPTVGFPVNDPNAPASAYVWDNAQGDRYTNYAFRLDNAVPEPATWAMMLIGFGAVGAAMRRRKSQPRVTVSFA